MRMKKKTVKAAVIVAAVAAVIGTAIYRARH
jgi:hypothetical protein